ncbi:MAG: Tad domain-containing protein [Candidatus Limnocylindrales bacterium]
MLLYPRALLRAGLNRIRALAGAEPLDDKAGLGSELKQAGQIVVIFALMLTVLIGLVGIAIDTTYAWRESLRVQRAADSAALAGVVYMPGNFNTGTNNATSIALGAATKNGYPVVGGVTSVSPAKVDANPRELDVTITTQVPTFFSRIFGINNWAVTRTARAVYVLPVPMGSPDPYYGAYGNFKVNGATVTLTAPGGGAITGRGFWATILSQGAGASSGDAYLPAHMNGDMSGTNTMQDTASYYDYDIVMPPGSTNGHVWIFDPVFCATDGRQGTGDYYLSGSGTTKMSSFFKLYDTNNQIYNLAGQTPLGSSGNFFANNEYTDPSAGGGTATAQMTSCAAGVSPAPTTSDPRYWHNKWFDLSGYIGASGTMSGGATGETYRLRTTSDPGDSSQDSTNAYNDFGIYVTSTGGSAQVYGQGAMEMYTPLPAGQASTFYLAQIDATSGAGKTIEIQLWDVGDTNGLSANLQILQPTTSGWSPVSSMTWTGTKVSTDSSSCPNGSGSSITTYSGGKLYNGCWLTIDVSIPTSYTAPQNGWWKITYNMGTGGTDMSTDLTTWQVNILGNPVHLIG